MTHRTAAILTIVAGGLMAVGSFLPWISARTGLGTVNALGTDGDGVVTLVIGIVVALTALVYLDRSVPQGIRVSLILGGLIGLYVVGADYGTAADRVKASTDLIVVSIGAGIYITAIGSVATIIGGWRLGTPVEEEVPRET